jgi:transposase
MEPTSMAWLPLSCFLIAKGYTVHVVKTRQVGALRKFFGINKSDRIDAQTLATVYLVRPKALNALYLPPANVKTIDRFCRQRARLVKQASAIKRRIWHLFTFANPKVIDIFGKNSFSLFGRAFLKEYISPHKIVETGIAKFRIFFEENSHGRMSPDIPEKLMEASLSAVQIYEGYRQKYEMPFDAEALQTEVNIELEMLESIEAKISFLDKEINKRYLDVDPKKHLQSVRGIADVLSPIIMATVGNIQRFRNVRAFRGFLSLAPKKSQSTDHDRKGLGVAKTSFWLLKQSFYMAAEVARHWDPEIAEFYYRLINRGKHHDQAVCACASKLAGRVYAVMKRMADPNCPEKDVPYVLRDLNHRPVDPKTAKQIIDCYFPHKKERLRREKLKTVRKQKSARQPQNEFDWIGNLMKNGPQNNNTTHDAKSVQQIFTEMLQAALTHETTK